MHASICISTLILAPLAATAGSCRLRELELKLTNRIYGAQLAGVLATVAILAFILKM